MTNALLRALLGTASLFFASEAISSELRGQWTLLVENPDRQAVATLKVEFTDEQARSCLGGDWKVLKVVSATTRDEDFFPSSDPLSYHVVDNQLTIGRNESCDAYLLLKGPLDGPGVKGEYFFWGQGGSTPLGYFELR